MVSGGGVLPPPPVSPVFAPPCPVFASAPAVPAVLCHTLAELHLWFGHVPAKLCYLEERTIDHFWRSLRLLPGHLLAASAFSVPLINFLSDSVLRLSGSSFPSWSTLCFLSPSVGPRGPLLPLGPHANPFSSPSLFSCFSFYPIAV